MNQRLKEVLERSKESKLVQTEIGRLAQDRSIGLVLFVYWVGQDNQITFLVCKRGNKTSEYKNHWNLPSGYLNWNETGEEGAARECWEECGIDINPDEIIELEHSTHPEENRQNVIFRYGIKLEEEPRIENQDRDKEEATEVKFINQEELDNYEFAFKQKETIKRLIKIIQK